MKTIPNPIFPIRENGDPIPCKEIQMEPEEVLFVSTSKGTDGCPPVVMILNDGGILVVLPLYDGQDPYDPMDTKMEVIRPGKCRVEFARDRYECLAGTFDRKGKAKVMVREEHPIL